MDPHLRERLVHDGRSRDDRRSARPGRPVSRASQLRLRGLDRFPARRGADGVRDRHHILRAREVLHVRRAPDPVVVRVLPWLAQEALDRSRSRRHGSWDRSPSLPSVRSRCSRPSPRPRSSCSTHRDRKIRLVSVGAQAVALVGLFTVEEGTHNSDRLADFFKPSKGFIQFHLNPLTFGREIFEHLVRVTDIFPGGPGWVSVLCMVAATAGLLVMARRGKKAIVGRFLVLMVLLAIVGAIDGTGAVRSDARDGTCDALAGARRRVRTRRRAAAVVSSGCGARGRTPRLCSMSWPSGSQRWCW